MKRFSMLVMCALAFSSVMADDVEVNSFSYAGPFPVRRPVMMDSVDVQSRTFSETGLLDATVDLASVEKGRTINGGALPGFDTSKAIHLLGFTIANTSYSSAYIKVDGLKHYQVFVDSKQVNGGFTTLLPSVHKVVIKYMSDPERQDTAKVTVDGDHLVLGTLNSETKRSYTINDAMNARTVSGVSVSPNGRYLIYSTSETITGGSTSRKSYVKDLQTGQVIDQRSGMAWMPVSNKYFYTRKNDGAGYSLVTVDPQTRAEAVLSASLPTNRFNMSPTEDYIIYSEESEGPKEKKEIFEVIEPDDRQPGWRKRSNLYMYDLKSGIVQQLTYGHHNVWLDDISRDGRYALISKSESRLEQRPTTVTSLFRLDLKAMTLDTLVLRDGFISSAMFSPDGRNVLLKGTPEALGGIGKNVAEGQTPSMYDYQLFMSPVISEGADYSPDKWKALTRDFNPNVQSVEWSSYDGQIYMTTEDKDYVHLYRLNPKTGKFQYIDCGEELLQRYSLALTSGVIAYSGQGASNGDRLYTMNTRNLKRVLVDDVDAERLASIKLGKCEAWEYINEEGDTVSCRYYLPNDFDAARKYPMIVNYYGGCSPTSRNFQSRYPQHAYAALGYVVLVVNPRGATGFGQKWSAAHVNTAGKGVAEDIIGAVKTFCKEHEFVNDRKIGCIGASYGGFMTQYLQTVTDIFAAAVSHAGISDHTSYWGEGYWGYSYSEVSMANSYPWTRKDLFVDQSPLYNADKVHTPLLFVHGTGDTNVPVGESIQMYTALKLLGRPTAMVLVDGENHWILDYNKRLQWQNTIWAWFAKYLQDDGSWWDSMYKHKDL